MLIAITQLAERRICSGNTFEWEGGAKIAQRVLNGDEAKIEALFEECQEPRSGLFD